MSNKEILKKKANETYLNNRKTYSGIIETAVRASRVYYNLPEIGFYPANENMDNVTLMNTDTISAIAKLDEADLCVLNFASFTHPGGNFLGGAMAQEEALCHSSTLYNILEQKTDFYERNNVDTKKGLYSDRAIYTPSVLFFTEDGNKTASVITCAAPNRASAQKENIPDQCIDLTLERRILFMYSIAKNERVKTLLLGAWGCGVFGNDPKEVCRLLLKHRPQGMKIVFAIPDKKNYDAFYETMQS